MHDDRPAARSENDRAERDAAREIPKWGRDRLEGALVLYIYICTPRESSGHVKEGKTCPSKER